ncbi:MAG TPA: serine protease [Mucilaginibacter sp.]|jgi:hypothetical protein|nr:serine protease [Mucilaginibacter sp.]
MSDIEILEQIERYLNGEMTRQERAAFEILRNENAEVNEKVSEHKHFTNLIKQYGERLELEKRLDAIHNEIDVEALEDELKIHPSFIVRLWRNHHSKISVAASIAIFSVLVTLFYTGYLTNRDRDLQLLGRKVDNIEKVISKLGRPAHINPGNLSGTGFAISSNGCILTDYHVVGNADTVLVQSVDGKSYRAKVVYTDPQIDIAVLKINDTSFKTLGILPYAFKNAETDIGESVFTLGYPRDAMVLGPGFVTANSGYQDDSTSYQMSILCNPGNSGGPLIDNKGNIIGIVDSKQTTLSGAAFALKSSYVIKAIQSIPADSLNAPLNLNTKNVLANLSRPQQIKKLQNYVFMISLYKQ